MTFNTIHWLPRHLAEMGEWQEICKAYDYLLSKAYDDVAEIYANEFLDSLTELGCLIWENVLGITVYDGETLEARKTTIKSFLSSDLPYTENKLREVLGSLAGPENVTLKVTQEDFEIKVDLTINAPGVISNVQNIVYKMRPSNMVVRICIEYSDTNRLYVGHAIKQVKELYPDSFDVVDPIDGLTWLVDADEEDTGDHDLLVDEEGCVLILPEEE